MQSAEEFAKIALDIYSDEIMPGDRKDIDNLSALIRARDRESVEACKVAMTKVMFEYGEILESKVEVKLTSSDLERIYDALDKVLCDLG